MRLDWDTQPVFKSPPWLSTLTSLGDIPIHVKGTNAGNYSGSDHWDGQCSKHCVDWGCREDQEGLFLRGYQYSHTRPILETVSSTCHISCVALTTSIQPVNGKLWAGRKKKREKNVPWGKRIKEHVKSTPEV